MSANPDSQHQAPWERVFIQMCLILLVITAAAKLLSLGGGNRILDSPDPVLGIPNRLVLGSVGGVELAGALLLVSDASRRAKFTVLWLLGSGMVTYRFVGWLLDVTEPCPCLGLLLNAVPLPAQLVQSLLLAAAVFLFLGSLAGLATSRGRAEAS